jgi:hypothetical protein
MLSVLLLDPHWELLNGPIYAFIFFIVGTVLMGLVIGIVAELRKDTVGSNGRAFIGLVILLLALAMSLSALSK